MLLIRHPESEITTQAYTRKAYSKALRAEFSNKFNPCPEKSPRGLDDSLFHENRSSDSIVNIFLPFSNKQTFLFGQKGTNFGCCCTKGDGSIWLVREKLNIKLWLSPQRPSPTLRKSMLARYLYNFSLLKTAEDSDAKPSLKSDKGRGKTNEL